MAIALRSARAVTVIDLTGRLSISADERESAPLRNAISGPIKAGNLDIVVNLSGRRKSTRAALLDAAVEWRDTATELPE
jgi:hypothetical protein